MGTNSVVLYIGALLITIIFLFYLRWKLPYRLKIKHFLGDWKDLQELCRDKSTWRLAIVDADKLVEKALKKRKHKGKSMGERMVDAQRIFTDNPGLWEAHNLCKKIVSNPKRVLSESIVKKALISYRQALKDLGALPNAHTKKRK